MTVLTRYLLWKKRAAPARPAARIRPATQGDFPAMLRIFRQVVEAGDAYVLPADTGVVQAHDYWFGQAVSTFVAERDGHLVGMYRIIENQRGRGAHVANASFVVDPAARRRGVGRALGKHCLAEAKRAGFLAMQSNMVVSTNTPAVALWRKLGFAV